MTKYDVYGGRNVDQAPLMLAKGIVPVPAVEFMLNRDAIMQQHGDIYVDTSDLPAYGGKGRSDEIKMILTVNNQGKLTELGRKALGLINTSQERSNGAIILSNQIYDSLEGVGVIPISRKEVSGYGLDNRVWRILMRDPNEVPAEFAYDPARTLEAVQRTREGVRAKGLDNPMGVYLDDAEKHAKLRAWYVDGLEDRSDAIGRYGLDGDFGRFLGIAPEAPNAPSIAEPKKVSNTSVKTYTPADLQAFDDAMKGLEGIIQPTILKPFVNLRKKL